MSLRKAKGENGMKFLVNLGQYFGFIKSYDPLKGVGFIFCKDLKDTFNTDVYVHGDACGNFGLSAKGKFAMSKRPLAKYHYEVCPTKLGLE